MRRSRSYLYTAVASFLLLTGILWSAPAIGLLPRSPAVVSAYEVAGTLQFSAATYSVAEDGGSVNIAVTRIFGSDGQVTVDYVTSGGTDSPGLDYEAASGTITFVTGDTDDKTSVISIINDGIAEDGETVTLTLSNPTGGAFLGSPNPALLIITINDWSANANEDSIVDRLDLGIVVSGLRRPHFGEPMADVNGDGAVNIRDLALVVRNLGRTAPQPLRGMRTERIFPELTFQGLTNLVQPDDGLDHIFVTEQPGRVRVFPNDQAATEAGTFLDISARVTQSFYEEGLLGLAFSPDYKNDGYFYVYYSADGPKRSVVSRFSVSTGDPEKADPGSEFVIMEVPQPQGNHNGGQLGFGPDGYLYISLGDGGFDAGNGQDRNTLLGSILRIDPGLVSGDRNYVVPADNPFVGVVDARDEIWAYGMRNPWRFSFDDRTEALWVADVGQNTWEEINVVEKGANYGWNTMEGRHCFSPAVDCNEAGLELPLWEYSHAEGCSITGGYVYRGRGLPSLLGAYVYGDFCTGKIWGLRSDGDYVTEHMLLIDSTLSITSFGQDLVGNLYILSQNQGIYRLDVPGP